MNTINPTSTASGTRIISLTKYKTIPLTTSTKYIILRSYPNGVTMAYKQKRTASSGKGRNKTQRNALRARKRVNLYRDLSRLATEEKNLPAPRSLGALSVIKYQKDLVVAQLQRMEHN